MPSRALALLPLLLLVACGGEPPPPVSGFATPAPSTSELRPWSSREQPGAAAEQDTTVTPDPNDPAEPGIGDLPRLARYVFRVMGSHGEVCDFENPFRDPVHFALDVEVRQGRIVRVGLGHAGLEEQGSVQPLAPSELPKELTEYVACLAPHLEAVEMDPAPADGSYEPAYSFGGQPAGKPRP
jgi:hypothetical protein